MRPTDFNLKLALGWVLIALVAGFLNSLVLLWQLSGMLYFALLIVEFWRTVKKPELVFTRSVHHNLPLNVWAKVTLKIQNNFPRTCQFQCYDHHPDFFISKGLPAEVTLQAGQSALMSYQLKPVQRGDAIFKGIEVNYFSKFKLWQSKTFYPLIHQVKVFPNFAEVSHYVLLATDNHQSQLGIKQKLRRGDGSEFLQLREYREGDALRQIDWKTSARLRKIISREYQDEKDQQIIFMLDCGRRMRHQSGHLSHLDQTLNAMLLLTYMATHQGDAVGFLTFAGSERWFAPLKGQQTLNRLLNRIYDIQSTTQTADYMNAARRLLNHQQKRSLVVILTNTRDEDAEDLTKAVDLLRTRHLVVLADLRESILDEVLNQEIKDLPQALDYLTVNDYSECRKRAHQHFQDKGSFVLDVTARQLPLAIVNQYIKLKDSALL